MKKRGFVLRAVLVGLCLSVPKISEARQSKIVWNDQEKPIAQQIGALRSLPDDAQQSTHDEAACASDPATASLAPPN